MTGEPLRHAADSPATHPRDSALLAGQAVMARQSGTV